MKRCLKCREEKDYSRFYRRSQARDGLSGRCKDCIDAHNKAKYHEDVEQSRAKARSRPVSGRVKAYRDDWFKSDGKRALEHRLKTKYGITLQQYEEMKSKQDERCAICSTAEAELSVKLFVDHDHKTGKVRMLLCSLCNSGLGYFKENPEILAKAISYINLFKEPRDE